MAEPVKWGVKVQKIGGSYKTIFNVDHQYFTLAEIEVCKGTTHKEARQHVKFIKDQFLKALAKLQRER